MKNLFSGFGLSITETEVWPVRKDGMDEKGNSYPVEFADVETTNTLLSDHGYSPATDHPLFKKEGTKVAVIQYKGNSAMVEMLPIAKIPKK